MSKSRTYLPFLILIILALALFSGCGRDDVDQVWMVIGPDGKEVTPEPEDPDDPDLVDWAAAVGYVFDADVIPEIHISVSRAEWEKLQAFYDANHNTQEYVSCDVLFKKGSEQTRIGNAGLRLKGNTSRRRPEDGNGRHVHFGLDFHHFEKDPDHTLKGLRKVDLKWFKDDAAYVREVFCYDLFRRYGAWTAVRDVYARLWVKVGDGKEAYYGVYGLLEHIDKNYLRVRKQEFGHKGGNLWKCRYGASLRDPNAYMGVDDDEHDFTYELKTNKEEGFAAAQQQLQGFIRKLNSLSGVEFYRWIASVTDVELLLKTYAVNVAVGMWDDYWANTNNYYLYFNTTDPADYKVFFIPYDYDNTLGTSLQMDAGRQDPYNWGSPDNPLIVKLLENNLWRDKYRGYLRELCLGNGLCSPAASQDRIRAWQSRISPYVSNDTGEDMSIDDRPASWGNHHEYRLLSGGSSANWFEVKAATVAAMK